MIEVAAIQAGHHNAIGAVVAHVAGVDPDQLAVIQPHQQSRDFVRRIEVGIDHGADARAGNQLHAFANHGRAIHDHQARITIRPGAAHIGGAFARIAFAHRIVIGDLVFVIGLGALIVLLRGLILLQLVLILGIVGVGLRIDRGIGGANLIVDRSGFSLLRRR